MKHLKYYKIYESLDYDFELDTDDHGYYKMDGELKDILNIAVDDGAVLSMSLADELMMERGSMENDKFMEALKDIFKRLENNDLLYNGWRESTYIKHSGDMDWRVMQIQKWDQYYPGDFDSFVEIHAVTFYTTGLKRVGSSIEGEPDTREYFRNN